MTALIDTSILIDVLRGHPGARALLEQERAEMPIHASEITRLEVLAGMRRGEEAPTRALLGALIWRPVTSEIAERAGEFGRRWLPSHHSIDGADLAIAATADRLDARLLTLNTKHYPMFAELRRPYG